MNGDRLLIPYEVESLNRREDILLNTISKDGNKATPTISLNKLKSFKAEIMNPFSGSMVKALTKDNLLKFQENYTVNNIYNFSCSGEYCKSMIRDISEEIIKIPIIRETTVKEFIPELIELFRENKEEYLMGILYSMSDKTVFNLTNPFTIICIKDYFTLAPSGALYLFKISKEKADSMLNKESMGDKYISKNYKQRYELAMLKNIQLFISTSEGARDNHFAKNEGHRYFLNYCVDPAKHTLVTEALLHSRDYSNIVEDISYMVPTTLLCRGNILPYYSCALLSINQNCAGIFITPDKSNNISYSKTTSRWDTLGFLQDRAIMDSFGNELEDLKEFFAKKGKIHFDLWDGRSSNVCTGRYSNTTLRGIEGLNKSNLLSPFHTTGLCYDYPYWVEVNIDATYKILKEEFE